MPAFFLFIKPIDHILVDVITIIHLAFLIAVTAMHHFCNSASSSCNFQIYFFLCTTYPDAIYVEQFKVQ